MTHEITSNREQAPPINLININSALWIAVWIALQPLAVPRCPPPEPHHD